MFGFSKNIPALSPQDTAAKLSGPGVGFIDVRTREEYADGHAEGASSIPLDELSGREGELQHFSEVYVICHTGGRSAQAVEYLRAHGVNAKNVSGGTAIWHVVGLPMA